MPIPAKDQMETLAALTAIAGASVTFLKGAVLWLTDHSDDRRLKSTADEICTSLTRLRELDAMKNPGPEVECYRQHLQESLEASTKWLETARERKRLSSQRKSSEPSGWRRRLLVYRATGFSGWVVQSMFYCMAVAAVTFAIGMAFDVRSTPSDLPWVLSGIPIVLLALYFRSVSHRLRRNAALAKSVGALPRAQRMNWFRRLLLLFWPRGVGAFFVHFFFGFSVLCVVLYVILTATDEPRSVFAILAGILFLFAVVFRADALARHDARYLQAAAVPPLAPAPPLAQAEAKAAARSASAN
jgi:hypothetical protein